MWSSIFNMGIAFAGTHPVWSIVGIFSAIWAIGKTYDKLTTPSYEESQKMLENLNQILQGKIPARKYTWQETLWSDFLKPILLSPFAIIFFPFAYVYKKLDGVVSTISTFAIFPILVIAEVIKKIRKGSSANGGEPGNTSTIAKVAPETNDVDKKDKSA